MYLWKCIAATIPSISLVVSQIAAGGSWNQGLMPPFFEILNYETSFWDWPYISYMLP